MLTDRTRPPCALRPHLLHGLVHDCLVDLGAGERGLRLGRPLELDAQQRHLGRVAKDKVLQRHLLHVAHRALDDLLHRVLHRVHQPLQPHLNVALGVDRMLKLNALRLWMSGGREGRGVCVCVGGGGRAGGVA